MRLLWWCVCLVLCLGSLPVQGQTPKPPSVSEQARSHFKAGRALYSLGYYKEAVAELTRAYELVPLPELLFNVALSYRRLGEIDKALAALDQFIDKNPADASQLKEAKRQRKELESVSGDRDAFLASEDEAAREEQRETLKGITAKAVPLIIVSEPAGARIVLNGGNLPDETSPFVGSLPAAKYVVEVTLDGYEPSLHEVRLDPKTPQPLFVTLTRKKTSLVVRVTPRAGTVSLDGERLGRGDVVGPLEVEAGSHRLLVERRFYGPWEETIELRPDARIDLTAVLGKDRFRKFLGGAFLAGGGGSVGLGLLAGLVAQTRAQQLEDFLAEEQVFNAEAQDLERRGIRAERIQIGMFALGGALALTGASVWVVRKLGGENKSKQTSAKP